MNIKMQAARRESVYAFKSIVRHPRFAIAVIFILSVGIGSVTFLYSVLNAVLFRQLPYRDPSKLVALWEYDTKGDHLLNHVSPANLETWRTENRSFAAIGAYDISKDLRMTLTGSGSPQLLRLVKLDAPLLRVLGVSPILGRTIVEDDDQTGRDHVVLLSSRIWVSTFGKDPNILGRTIMLDDEGYTVIGIMPSNFSFPSDTGTFNPTGEQRVQLPDAWMPLALTPRQKENRGAHMLQAIGRLRNEVSPEAADAELKVIQRRILQQHPADYIGSDARVVSLHSQSVSTVRPTLIALFGAVTFMLLVACLNVANLFMVRATEKEKEYAVRLALGADHLLLVWNAISEILITCLVASVAAVAIAYGSIRFWRGLSTFDWIDNRSISLNWEVLAFALGIAVCAALLVGVFPMLRVRSTNIQSSLRDDSRGASSSGNKSRSRDIAVIVQVGVACALVVVATLLLQSLSRLNKVDPGFRADGISDFEVSLPNARYQQDAQRREYFEGLLASIRVLPGVISAGATSALPLSGDDPDTMVNIAGRAQDPNNPIIMNTQVVDADYFRTMAIALRAGRLFSRDDSPNSPHVAILNQTAVKQYFRGENPIGKRIQQLPNQYYCEIVGVIDDVRHEGLDRDSTPQIFQPALQAPQSTMSIVVKSSMSPSALGPGIAHAVQKYDPEQSPPTVTSLEDQVAGSLAKSKFRTWLIGILALSTVALACLGIYSTVAYSVALRRKELCIRVALGAGRGNILWLILSQTMRLVLIGIGVGTCIALATGSGIGTLLFGIAPYDVSTYGIVAGGLGLTGLLSALGPALRALSVNPREVIESQ